MTRMGIISVDGHVKAPWDAYRDYLDPKWRTRYDEWVKAAGARPDFCHAEFGQEAQWNVKRRVADLESQGVVAEVVFPNGIPFTGSRDRDEVCAGYAAYNRWVSDACAEVSGRMYAQAHVDFRDIDAAVKQIHEAKAKGFVSILMPPLIPEAGCRYFFDPALDPIWAACVDTGLPLSQHGGVGAPSYQPMIPAAFLVLATEHWFFSARSLWQLILAGVFDRFPRLKIAYIETEAWWLRPILERLDRHHDLMMAELSEADKAAASFFHTRPYRRQPSEYLQTNIFMGISPFRGAQVDIAFPDDGKDRKIITTENAMMGADYPHPETALPWLRDTVGRFAKLPNISAAGARRVIYGNAATLFGIDLAPLRPHIERVGFELETEPA